MSFSADFLAWLKRDARRCLLAEIECLSGGVTVTRRVSNIGYKTSPSDTPANTRYAGRICGGGRFSRALPLAGGSPSLSFGDLELENTDGGIDSWLDDIWANRAIVLKMGDPSWAYVDFETVFVGTVEDIAVKSRARFALKLRDVMAPLNGPISTATVGGAGQNKDELLPITLGEVFNIEPLMIEDAASQVYQFSVGAAERVIEVRDNGFPVSITTDLAAGKFTLNQAKYGRITADVQGATISGSYRNDVGGLIEWVATTLGDGEMLSSGDFDAAALSAFRSAHPQPVGLWFDARANRIEIMQRLAATLGASVVPGLDGKLRIVQLDFGTSARTISPRHMHQGSFGPVRVIPPRGAISLAGCQNWAPQEPADLAEAVSADSKAVLQSAVIKALASDAGIIADYRQSAVPADEESLLIAESDLQDEADRRLSIWGEPRRLYRFEAFPDLFDLALGDTVTLQYPRLGLSSGRDAVVVMIDTDFLTAESTVEVLV